MAKIDDLHDLKLLHEHKLAVMAGKPTLLDTHYKTLAALSVWQRHAESDDYVNALADVNATETRLERAKHLYRLGWRIVFRKGIVTGPPFAPTPDKIAHITTMFKRDFCCVVTIQLEGKPRLRRKTIDLYGLTTTEYTDDVPVYGVLVGLGVDDD